MIGHSDNRIMFFVLYYLTVTLENAVDISSVLRAAVVTDEMSCAPAPVSASAVIDTPNSQEKLPLNRRSNDVHSKESND